MEYLGRIMERGLIKPLRTSFTPGVDSIMMLSSVTENISDADRKVLDSVGVISGGDRYYSGKLTQEQLKVTEKYFVYSNGTLEARQRES